MVVKKLLGSKGPGVYEIRPEILKALEIVGLSCLTCLFSVPWRSGQVNASWVVPIFEKREQSSIHPSTHPSGLLLWVIWSLYNQSETSVCTLCTKSSRKGEDSLRNLRQLVYPLPDVPLLELPWLVTPKSVCDNLSTQPGFPVPLCAAGCVERGVIIFFMR